MYTDDEIKKAGTDAGFTTHEVDTLFYQLIENKKHEPQQLLQQCNFSGALRQKLQQSIDVLTAEGVKYERMKTKDVIDLLKYLQGLAQ